jgi:antitoxin component YwqK of YwqJK toxin-antitoxin module
MEQVHDNSIVDITKFVIYFDYLCETDPKFSSSIDDVYINAYIAECINNTKVIVTITDINENIIDSTDSTNFDLIERIKNAFCLDYYSTYDIARHNMIYIIYFGKPKSFDNDKYNINIYKTIRDKLSYTGVSYYYDIDGTILCKCFHINGSIEGKFYGYYYCKPLPTVGGENWELPNGYVLSTTYITKYDIDYVNGKLHGKYIKYHRNGQIQTYLNYVDGKIIGKTYSYYEDGSIETECIYIDGKIEGEYISYCRNYYNIIVGISNYVNGKLNGKSREYIYSSSKDTNTLTSDCDYVNGKRNGVKNIYKDGKLYRTITYKDNKKNGLSTYMGKTKYGNGYYIQIEKTYKDGYRNGINKYYNDLGQITMTKTYKNGGCYNESYYYSTGVKKESIDITYDDTPIYTEYNMCTKEFNVTQKYNESGELVQSEKKTKIIEHDGYENCSDSDYYDDERIYRDTCNYINGDDRDDEKLCTYEYLHFVNI